MVEHFDLTIAEAALQISQRQLSPVALMESLLSRSKALEADLNIWVTLEEEAALDAALQSEKILDQSGPRGPLHGIPIGVKDIYYTKGIKTTCCSPIYADFVPSHDATAVALLKKAGAIIMGKTVTTEFACADPSPTRNPWNLAHTPGGSSSGSAVGVAARVFPASLGTQTGGSVLRPASYNGVVGLKPTFSRISRYGVMPVSWSLDTMGIFTRTVEDAALMLSVLAGHDSKDFSSSTMPVPDYHRRVGTLQSPLRIGLLRKFFFERCDDEVRRHTEGITQSLAAAGALVEEVIVPTDFHRLLAAHKVLMNVELAAVQQPEFSHRPHEYSPNIRSAIESGMLIPAVTYLQAQRIRRAFRRDMEAAIADFDVILTPSTTTAAPRDLNTTGNPMFQSPWTTCGFPTFTLPSGLSELGLPLGIQLAAAPFDEETLIAAATWCETVLGVTLKPPNRESSI